MKKSDARNIIVESIRSNIDINNDQETILKENPEDFEIIGSHDNIDSLDLVSILVDVEAQVHDKYGKIIMLSSDKAMSQNNSPFRNVKTLTLFLIEEFENEK